MHQRKRHILSVFTKRSRLWPVLALLGARQTGKSTFLREVWAEAIGGTYATFDEQETRSRASRSCEHFLLSNSMDLTRPFLIDEAHKVLQIFDSIKALIDKNRRVGIFTLSGSVEFGDKAGVRESLTGRIGLAHLYPFTLREANNKSFMAPWAKYFQRANKSSDASKQGNKKPNSSAVAREIETWLERGGMPIFCPLHDEQERQMAVQAWADAICYRDLHQLKGAKYDSDVALASLRYIAQHPFCNASDIALELGEDSRVIKKNLKGLEALFVLYELSPRRGGLSKSAYLLFDAGVARAFGATRKQVIPVFFVNEILSQLEYSGCGRPMLFHYRSKNGSRVDLMLELNGTVIGINFEDKVSPSRRCIDSLAAFKKISPSFIPLLLCPVQKDYEERDSVQVVPWKDSV